TGDDPRRCHPRVVIHQPLLHRVELALVADGRNLELDDLAFGVFATAGRVADGVSAPADIDRVGQQLVERTDTELATLAGLITVPVQPGRNGGDAEGWGAAGRIALKVQIENQPDEIGFHLVDGQDLLDLRAALFGCNCLVPEWRR